MLVRQRRRARRAAPRLRRHRRRPRAGDAPAGGGAAASERLRGARVVLIAVILALVTLGIGKYGQRGAIAIWGEDDWVVSSPHHAARHQLLRVPHAAVRVRLHARRDQGERPAAAGRVHDVHPDLPGRPARDVPGLLREAHPRVRPPGVLLRPAAHRARLLQEGLRRRLPVLDLLRQDHHDDRQHRLRPRRREHVVAARLLHHRLRARLLRPLRLHRPGDRLLAPVRVPDHGELPLSRSGRRT